jgi:photosystem II stability/assembly factor-like uncharacterized protein
VPFSAAVKSERGLASFAVSPHDPRVIYGAWRNSLHRTDDSGTNWRQLVAIRYSQILLEMSAADPRVVYHAGMSGSASELNRSDDGGTTWRPLRGVGSDSGFCNVWIRILAAHPTNPERVHFTADCYAGRNIDDALRESTDRGRTWRSAFRPQREFPEKLVGGQGTDPNRWYLGTSLHPSLNGGLSVFKSIDDGRTWTRVLHAEPVRFDDGSAMGMRIAGLAFDPNRPDRVYAAMNRSTAKISTPVNRSGLLTSDDGG